MNLLERRVVRLEGVNRGRRCWRFSDAELDAMMRAELAAFMRDTPEKCPADVVDEVLAFLAADDGEATP